MPRPDDIVGYTYKADHYCPTHIIGRLRTGPGEDFDGWALALGIIMGPEANLDEIAAHFGIDRHDEASFDTDYFPKVIFRDAAEDSRCGECGIYLGADHELQRRHAHPSDGAHWFPREL